MFALRAGATALTCALAAALWAGCSSGHHDSGSLASAAPASTSGGTTGAGSTPTGPIPVYGTRKCWPIVLVHGFGGFRNVGPVEYWYHIPEALRAQGYEVFVVQDTAWDTVAIRAGELHDQILAQYPDPRVQVNLIGHSMGGLDCRYAVSRLGLGNKVASVTTIGTPHHGSSVADVILGTLPGPVASATNIVFNLIGMDLQGGGEDLTTWDCNTQFNPNTPDVPGVAYFSWAGMADPLGVSGCVLEPWLLPAWSILENVEGDNDGLVSVASAEWGDYQGVVPADHLNEVGQPAGVTTFGYEAFFESWADQLEARGFGPP